MKPLVFVAYSSEDIRILNALQDSLKHRVLLKPWTIEGHAELGSDILDWAISETRRCEFGLFILSSDSRWGGQPNGNVLLELGLFIGALGPTRAFILKPHGLEVPTDLKGRILAEYDPAAFAQNERTALASACENILEAVRRRSNSLVDNVRGLWIERKVVSEPEGPFSLVQFDMVAGEPQVQGRSYDRNGNEKVSWPGALTKCWLPPAEDQLFHVFDAKYGDFDAECALGVSVFKFHPDWAEGTGYYIVHGGSGIQSGAVSFTLQRVTPDLLRDLGLNPVKFSIDDHARCSQLIRHLCG